MILLWFPIIDEREYLFIKKRPPKVRCAIDQKLEKREICTRLLAGSEVFYFYQRGDLWKK